MLFTLCRRRSSKVLDVPVIVYGLSNDVGCHGGEEDEEAGECQEEEFGGGDG